MIAVLNTKINSNKIHERIIGVSIKDNTYAVIHSNVLILHINTICGVTNADSASYGLKSFKKLRTI